jgi:hypothetical protein
MTSLSSEISEFRFSGLNPLADWESRARDLEQKYEIMLKLLTESNGRVRDLQADIARAGMHYRCETCFMPFPSHRTACHHA